MALPSSGSEIPPCSPEGRESRTAPFRAQVGNRASAKDNSTPILLATHSAGNREPLLGAAASTQDPLLAPDAPSLRGGGAEVTLGRSLAEDMAALRGLRLCLAMVLVVRECQMLDCLLQAHTLHWEDGTRSIVHGFTQACLLDGSGDDLVARVIKVAEVSKVPDEALLQALIQDLARLLGTAHAYLELALPRAGAPAEHQHRSQANTRGRGTVVVPSSTLSAEPARPRSAADDAPPQ